MTAEKMIEEYLRKKGEALPVPEELDPKRIQQRLEGQKKRKRLKIRRRCLSGLAAACVCLSAGALWYLGPGIFPKSSGRLIQADKETRIWEAHTFAEVSEEEQELLELPKLTYEEIYARLSEGWERQEALAEGAVREESRTEAGILELGDVSAAQKQGVTEAFGQTNNQVEQVNEADRIQNDGRYLYQIAVKQGKEEEGEFRSQTGIQILDTKEGLKEVAFLADFESLEAFYLWENLLITIENKYDDTEVLPADGAKRESAEDMACCKMPDLVRGYHEICIYQIEDRSRPRKQKTFTLQGTYETSRVSDGYFYGISRFAAGPGEGEQDYDAYIPSVDGKRLSAEQIYCPPEADGTEYLVLVSVDLENPQTFVDSQALLAGAGTYYVSPYSIYSAWYQSVYERKQEKEGTVQDMTRLLRFSYRKGHFYAQAEGEIPGRIKNSFSMDEYDRNLRVAVTVQEYDCKEVKDDRTGEIIGMDYGQAEETNALYILDASLNVTGRLEGLAKGETIRSARFLGHTGYLVTFRQMDPLFTVDLSDPEHPEVFKELKVSGFSEYLHVYGNGMLLGIGMEADEESGRELGMKLSMFDVLDPEDPKEAARFPLEQYHYSEALYEHRAVLIDPQENIIGFEAQGSDRGEFWKDYLLFSWQEDQFVQTLKIDTRRTEEDYCRTRGTFIGDTFYLLFEDGAARAYDRSTGTLLEEL